MVLGCPALPFASLQCLPLTEFGGDGFMGHTVWTHTSPGVPSPGRGRGSSHHHKEYGNADRGHLRVPLTERSRQPVLGHWPGVPSPRLCLASKRWIKQHVDV